MMSGTVNALGPVVVCLDSVLMRFARHVFAAMQNTMIATQKQLRFYENAFR
jgi:hypothetical protein